MDGINIRRDSPTNEINFSDDLDFDIDDNLNIERKKSDRDHNFSNNKKEVPFEDINLLANSRKPSHNNNNNDNISIHSGSGSTNFYGSKSGDRLSGDKLSDDGNHFDNNNLGYGVEPGNDGNFNDDYDGEVEKQKRMLRFWRKSRIYFLNKQDVKSGYKTSKKLSLVSNLEDIKYEYDRIKKERDVEKSIRFSRKALMACVSGVEFLNGKFDPFDVKLDGWSENIMENINEL